MLLRDVRRFVRQEPFAPQRPWVVAAGAEDDVMPDGVRVCSISAEAAARASV